MSRKAKDRERAYGGPDRIAWVQRLPCWVCGHGASQNAHVKTGGMGRKADARWIVPLCESHHHELHQHGQKTFEKKHSVDLAFAAQIVDARWQVHQVLTQPSPPSDT